MKSGFFFTTNEIRPLGWIKDQLRLQADGLCGHLDLVWPDIRDSHYVGGNAEDWERVPYWLDGFIPLAYLLEDEVLIQRAKKYIDGMLSYQREDGWICPCDLDHLEEYDTWAVLLISKVLTVYYQCSKDDRIPSCLYRMMKNYYQLLSSGSIVLHDWGKYRWFEGYFAILFLETLFHEPWIMELAAILHKQGKDYHEEVEKWKKPCYEWTLDTHIVNLAMMLKSEALYCAVFHEPYTDQAEYFYHLLDTYNGTPVCTFTGDECLSGLHPNHGTELCSVVELMFSYETLYALTGDKKWAERLEICAFNALPATISDDMWSHQYDQMSNQISCEKFPGKSIFCTNGPEAHLFGLEPQFGCCTANFGQGFPKLALSAFLQCENEIHAAILLPCELHCSKGTIHLETDYPFKNEADFTIQAREDFRFSIRIPSFAQNVCLSGSSQMPELDCKKGNTYSIHLSFDTKSILSERPHHLVCVKKPRVKS